MHRARVSVQYYSISICDLHCTSTQFWFKKNLDMEYNCTLFGYCSYTDLRDKLYYISGAPLCLFRAVTVIFLGLHTVHFPVESHAGIVYVFCACVTKKKGENSNIYWLDCKKFLGQNHLMVIFNFEIVLFSKGLYFHPCNKNTEPWGKCHFYGFCANWAVMSL